jgi:hypothetical protein
LECGKAGRLVANIANIWDSFQTANFRNVLKAGKGFEGISCQKLAFPAFWLYEEWLNGKLSTDPRLSGKDVGLSLIMNCQGLKETGYIDDNFSAREVNLAEIDISHQKNALTNTDWVRYQWEEYEELRGHKLPELCVWNKDGERIKRAKKEA